MGGLGIVFVFIMIRNVNDYEFGVIINFGFNYFDIVRGVNF